MTAYTRAGQQRSPLENAIKTLQIDGCHLRARSCTNAIDHARSRVRKVSSGGASEVGGT